MLHPAAPRLACVKPVASVHPEPGSNSSLYDIFRLPDRSGRHFVSFLTRDALPSWFQGIDGSYFLPNACPRAGIALVLLCLYGNFFQRSALRDRGRKKVPSVVRGLPCSSCEKRCKGRAFFLSHQIFLPLFCKKSRFLTFSAVFRPKTALQGLKNGDSHCTFHSSTPPLSPR